MRAVLPIRGQDAYGSGEFGAPRSKTDADGNRVEYGHEGEDFACYPGTTIFPERDGQVTKLGYPYGDDLSFRYVEVTDVEGLRWRYFYVDPAVDEGQGVNTCTPLGETQELRERYPDGMVEHCHREILDQDGQVIDPEGL